MVDRAGGLDQLFSPGDRLIVLDAIAEDPHVGGEGGSDIEVGVVGGPAEPCAQTLL